MRAHRGGVDLARGLAVGGRASLLSMYVHEELVPLVRGFGIEPHFVRVEGRVGPSGGSKAEHMVRHIGSLAHVSRSARW